MRRITLALAVLALAAASPAAAKIWFMSVRGDTYRVGAVVRTAIAGCPDPCPVRGTRVWLAPMDPVGPRRRLGSVDRRGVLRFTVPSVRPGSFVLFAEGRRVSDSFRITR